MKTEDFDKAFDEGSDDIDAVIQWDKGHRPDLEAKRVNIDFPTHRAPTHPGEMLLEEFLLPMNISQRELADAIYVPYQRVNELINGKRGITPSTALRLARFFGMSADFWLNLQLRWELYKVQEAEKSDIEKIAVFQQKTA